MSATSNPHGANNSHSTGSDIDETITIIVVALAKAVAALVWWSVLFPMISIPILASAWVGFRYGPVFGLVLAAVSGSGLGCLVATLAGIVPAVGDPRMRTRWRTWWIYRHRWTAICTLHGLTAKLDEQTLVPALRSVTIGTHQRCRRGADSDRPIRGRLAEQSSGPGRGIARPTGNNPLHQARRDQPSPPITVMRWPPRSGCPAPRPRPRWTRPASEWGHRNWRWWRLPVLGQHILVAGATGSGKGSVLWSIIAGLAPGVRAGSVRLLVVDPKGGMEFGRGQKLFTGFAHDNGEHTLGLLRRSRRSCSSARSGCAVRPACTPPPSPNR